MAAQWPHATSKYPQIAHTLELKILRKDTCIKKAGLDDTLRRCDKIIDVSLGPPLPSESFEWI
jgi:hypothetical protein